MTSFRDGSLKDLYIYVAHVVVDGEIKTPAHSEHLTTRGLDGCLDSGAIVETYLHLNRQHRSPYHIASNNYLPQPYNPIFTFNRSRFAA